MSVMAMVLVYMGVEDGWFRKKATAPAAAPTGVWQIEDSGAPALALPAAGAVVAPSAADAPPATVAASNTELGKIRKNMKNSLHFVATFAGGDRKLRLCDAQLAALLPLRVAFGESIKNCKTVGGVKEWWMRMANPNLPEVENKIAASLEQPETVERLHFAMTTKITAEEARVEDEVAKYFGDLLLAQLGSRCKFGLFYSWSPPAAFARLVHDDDVEVNDCLQRLRSIWEAYEALEKQAVLKTAREARDNLVWPNLVYVMENFAMLAEANFTRVVPALKERIIDQIKGWQGSNIVEDCFNMLRDEERQSKSATLCRRQRMIMVQDSHLVPDNGRMKTAVTDEARAHAWPSLPQNFFTGGSPNNFSLGLERLHTWSTETIPWPSASAFFHQGIANLLLTQTGGDMNRLSSSWLGLLCSRGAVLHVPLPPTEDDDVDDTAPTWNVSMVVKVTEKGVISWPCTPFKEGALFGVTLKVNALPIVHCIDRTLYKNCKIAQCTPIAPFRAKMIADDAMSMTRWGKVTMSVPNSSNTLTRHSALRGYPGLTTKFLEDLALEEDIRWERKPKSLKQWLQLLLPAHLPDMSPEEINAIIERRLHPQKHEEFNELLTPEMEENVKSVFDKDELDLLKKMKSGGQQKTPEKKEMPPGADAANRDKDATTGDGVGPGGSSSTGSGSSGGSGDAAPLPSAPTPPAGALAPVDAAALAIFPTIPPAILDAWLPKVSGASCKKRTDNKGPGYKRWRAAYPKPDPPYSCSKNFVVACPVSELAAQRHVLMWIWSEHEKAKPDDPRPWKFPDE